MKYYVNLVLFLCWTVGVFVLGGAAGYHQGLETSAYYRGEEYGTQSTLATINHLLADAQTQYQVQYTSDGTYHLIIKQKIFKREPPRRKSHEAIDSRNTNTINP